VSLRYLYRLPEEDRICPGCGKPIQRNIFRYGNDLLHYGCYRKLKAREQQGQVIYPRFPRPLAPIPGSKLPPRGRWE